MAVSVNNSLFPSRQPSTRHKKSQHQNINLKYSDRQAQSSKREQASVQRESEQHEDHEKRACQQFVL